MTTAEKPTGTPTRAKVIRVPFHDRVPPVPRTARGATFVQRAVTVSERAAPPASIAVMVTGMVASSPPVAVHDQVRLPRVTVPVEAVAETAGPSAPSAHVPVRVRALPSGAVAGAASRKSCGPLLASMPPMTSMRGVVAVPWPDG